MRINNDTTPKLILKEFAKTIGWCVLYIVAGLSVKYFMTTPRPNGIVELWNSLENSLINYMDGSDVIFWMVALPFAFFIIVFIINSQILLQHTNKNTQVKTVEFLSDTVTFYFADKSPALTCPYEALANIRLNLNLFLYANPLLRNDDEYMPLTQLNVVFNFPQDKKLEVTNFTFQNLPFSLIKKIIDYSRNKCELTYRITGDNTKLADSYSYKIEDYMKYGHQRLCAKIEKGSLIKKSSILMLVGWALMFTFLAIPGKLTTGEWIGFGIGALITLISFYLDIRLIQDELFDYQSRQIIILPIWLLPIWKTLALVLSWWLLKINYYI